MRTFIAIPLPAEARALLAEIQNQLRAFDAEVGWTATSSIHLTLKFLGEIEPAALPGLTRQLRAGAALERPFRLNLVGIGGFPSLRNPRVIWCGLEGDVATLASLQRAVEGACRNAGFAPEDSPFHPHLTVGRVRGKTNLQPLLDYIRICSTRDYAFEISNYHVYQSTLKPQGAVYTVLETIGLRDGGRQ